MKNYVMAIMAVSALTLAGPVRAQMVNGTPGPGIPPPAPIGTKAAGPAATMQTPEASRAAGAAQKNEKDFNRGSTGTSSHRRRHHETSSSAVAH